jgi:hypothetical protein
MRREKAVRQGRPNSHAASRLRALGHFSRYGCLRGIYCAAVLSRSKMFWVRSSARSNKATTSIPARISPRLDPRIVANPMIVSRIPFDAM